MEEEQGVLLFPKFEFRDYCFGCAGRRRDVEGAAREIYELRRQYDRDWLAERETPAQQRRFSELARQFDRPCRCRGRYQIFIGGSDEALLHPAGKLGGNTGYFTHVKYGLW